MGVISKTELHHSSAGVERQVGDYSLLKLPPGLWRFTKFCMVGGSGMLVDMTVLYLLADPSRLAWNITFSKICAAEIAMMNNFTWNELWTFRALESSDRLLRLIKFNLICTIGIGFAIGLLHAFHGWLGFGLYLSNFLAITTVTFWNFGMNATFNWGTGAHAPKIN